MSFTVNFANNTAIINFNEKIEKTEFQESFLEIVDTINVLDLKCVVFDCSKTKYYSIQDNHLEKMKQITKLSKLWNPDMTIIFIATNPTVVSMVNDVIYHKSDLKWKYYLFKNRDDAYDFLP